jgi:RNase H-like domain found in reverse transcriptase
VWATKQTRPYLERKEFVIRTDHVSLRWMFSAASENPRVCRWRLALAEFQFAVEHRPGRSHVAPTASRGSQPRARRGRFGIGTAGVSGRSPRGATPD